MKSIGVWEDVFVGEDDDLLNVVKNVENVIKKVEGGGND